MVRGKRTRRHRSAKTEHTTTINIDALRNSTALNPGAPALPTMYGNPYVQMPSGWPQYYPVGREVQYAYTATRWQLAAENNRAAAPGVPAPARRGMRDSVMEANEEKQTEEDEEEDIGCPLHDLGEWCPCCGDVTAPKPEKFGGKPAEPRRLNISSATGSLFDDIDFTRGSLLTGLPRPRPQNVRARARARAPAPAPAPLTHVPHIAPCCKTCGTSLSVLKAKGPGHCAGCRFLWLADFQAEKAKAARVATAEKKERMGKGGSRYHWTELGYELE